VESTGASLNKEAPKDFHTYPPPTILGRHYYIHLLRYTGAHGNASACDICCLQVPTIRHSMKLSTLPSVALLTAVVGARFTATGQVPLDASIEERQYLLEFPNGGTQWVTGDEKWELKRVSRNHNPWRMLDSGDHRMVISSWISRNSVIWALSTPSQAS
jgi:hypothetical protein